MHIKGKYRIEVLYLSAKLYLVNHGEFGLELGPRLLERLTLQQSAPDEKGAAGKGREDRLIEHDLLQGSVRRDTRQHAIQRRVPEMVRKAQRQSDGHHPT